MTGQLGPDAIRGCAMQPIGHKRSRLCDNQLSAVIKPVSSVCHRNGLAWRRQTGTDDAGMDWLKSWICRERGLRFAVRALPQFR